MKKYFVSGVLATLVIVSVFSFNIFTPITKVSAQTAPRDICQMIEVFIQAGIISSDLETPARIYLGCANPVASTTQPSITLTSPNGGENLSSGTTTIITWSNTHVGTSSVRLSWINSRAGFSTSTQLIIATTSTGVATGSYSWLVPSLASGHGYNMILASLNNFANVADYSNNYFTISSSTASSTVTVTSPNTAVTYKGGDTITVGWDIKNTTPGTKININLVNASGTVRNLRPQMDPRFGNHLDNKDNPVWLWELSDEIDASALGSYKIEICLVGQAGSTFICDVSDAAFTLAARDTTISYPKITLEEPVITDLNVSLGGSVTTATGINTTWCKIANPSATGNGPYEFSWGNGKKSCSSFPATTTYAEDGRYKITVKAVNSQNATSTKSVQVQVHSSTYNNDPKPQTVLNEVAPVDCQRGIWYGSSSALGLWKDGEKLSDNSDKRFLCHTDTNIYRCTKTADETNDNTGYWQTMSIRVNDAARAGSNYMYVCDATLGKWKLWQ